MYQLSLILEDFEDGPDHVEHSQRKVDFFFQSTFVLFDDTVITLISDQPWYN